MDFLVRLTDACSSVAKPSVAATMDPLEDASEIQLNAFEFRNYRCAIDAGQQKLLERVVNQWCAMLVKGKTMRVNDAEEKVYLDKDMLTLEISNIFYPLKAICKMEMFQDDVDYEGASQWALDLSFSGSAGETSLKFNFDAERQRLNFALSIRILRTRDPTLDPSSNIEVFGKEEEEEPEPQTFGRIVNAHRYGVAEIGIPIVFSVSDLKVIREIKSSSRHSYLEFFVKYPRQDKFLYAKSPTTHIPQNVLMSEDAALRRKKEKKDEQQEEDERKKEETKRKVLGDEVPIAAMRFELKNVKIKVPRVPHTIFGRLMAKDDYFPTAIGTFDFEVTKKYLQNKLSNKGNHKEQELPATLSIPLMSSWKMRTGNDSESFQKIGILTIRLMGYVSDEKSAGGTPSSPAGGANAAAGAAAGSESPAGGRRRGSESKASEDSGSGSGSGSDSGSSSGSS